jgi:hypothetical protein
VAVIVTRVETRAVVAVPEMVPVLLMLIPGGSPEAVNVSDVPEKFPATLNAVMATFWKNVRSVRPPR